MSTNKFKVLARISTYPSPLQVTTYAHKDENNMWIIKPADTQWTKTDSPELVKSGDLVRLEHIV